MDTDLNTVDYSKYKIRYYFDDMEFLLKDNAPDNNTFDPSKVKFVDRYCDEGAMYRYFKTRYPNRDLFLREIVDGPTAPLDELPDTEIPSYIRNELYPRVIDGYDNAKPYSHDEALMIENEDFRLLVLDTLQSKEEEGL